VGSFLLGLVALWLGARLTQILWSNDEPPDAYTERFYHDFHVTAPGGQSGGVNK